MQHRIATACLLSLEKEGVQSAMIPAKITSEPPDLQNDLQAPGNRLPASVTSPSLPSFCLQAPHFGSNKKYLAFVFTKNLLFQKFST